MPTVYPPAEWGENGLTVSFGDTPNRPVIDIVEHSEKNSLAATSTGMFLMPGGYLDALNRAAAECNSPLRPYWSARAQFYDVHAARKKSTPVGNKEHFTRSAETGRWTASIGMLEGAVYTFADATPFTYAGDDTNMLQLCSARSAAQLGRVPTDALLLHTGHAQWYDTFNYGNVCVFGMPLSDSPVLCAALIDDVVSLVVLRSIHCGDDLTLPTARAADTLSKKTTFPILRTVHTPPYSPINAYPIPENTQVVTTTGPAIRSCHNLNRLKSLRCVLGAEPVLQADPSAVPDGVVMLVAN